MNQICEKSCVQPDWEVPQQTHENNLVLKTSRLGPAEHLPNMRSRVGRPLEHRIHLGVTALVENFSALNRETASCPYGRRNMVGPPSGGAGASGGAGQTDCLTEREGKRQSPALDRPHSEDCGFLSLSHLGSQWGRLHFSLGGFSAFALSGLFYAQVFDPVLEVPLPIPFLPSLIMCRRRVKL